MNPWARIFGWLTSGWPRAAAPAEAATPAPPAQAVEAQPAPLPAIQAAGARFAAALNFTAREEGGWSDHPNDPGGATNHGITIAALAAWRGKPVTAADVRALTTDEARAIYRANYWNPVRGDDLPHGLDVAVFDWAVNAGPGRAVRGLQRILGVSADGAMGPVTLGAIQKHDRATLINALCDARLSHLRGLDTWPVFGKGWSGRVARVRAAALAG